MFKNLLNKFKKDKEPENSGPLTVRDLSVGCILEYDMRTFVVKDAYEYNWGDNCISKEYKISDGEETLYLNVEDEDELEISLFTKLKVRKIQEDLPEVIRSNNEKKPPKVLNYDGTKYYYDRESLGLFRDCKNDKDKDDSWVEFVNWLYYDDDDSKILSIEQWGEDDFQSATGKLIKEYQISSILPSPTK
jgi:hypothetical protein